MARRIAILVVAVLGTLILTGFECTPDPPSECSTNSDCYDGFDCTLDACQNGSCENWEEDARCADDEFCSRYFGCLVVNDQPEPAVDTDGDGWDDAYDNCPNSYNPYQENMDGDNWGNACDCDADGDLHVSYACFGFDCNDLNFYVHPYATEWCANGVDDDCDGLYDTFDICWW